jgi:hypothetical protein
VILLSLFVIPSNAKNIYKWVDKYGVPHFIDDPAKVTESEKGKTKMEKTL